MTENPEKKAESKEEKPETKEEDNTEDKMPENDDEKHVWVDKNGKKPISYLLPIYIGVGVVLLIIWILIIVFTVQPEWEDFEYELKNGPGLEVDVVPNEDTEDGDIDEPYTDNTTNQEDGSTGNQSRPNN